MSIKRTRMLRACLIIGSVRFAAAAQLPPGFVYLADVDPTIRQDIRYASVHNFVGRRIEGYLAGECVLTERAAQALKQVQAEAAVQKRSLIVWDCYRPARAVRDFLAWSKVPSDVRMKGEFFPNTDKTQLFALGYLAQHSAHSRGSTVDLGVVPGNLRSSPAYDPSAPLKSCTAPKGQRFEDGTVDFGTGYDCLDLFASTNNPDVGRQVMSNRIWLQELMRRFGFRPYSREWWHFEFIDEPFPQQAFDFPIMPRVSSVIAKPAVGSSIRTFWTSFQNAVLKRDSSAVVNMTKFPFPSPAGEMDQVAFVAGFEELFNGRLTACVAIAKLATDPKPDNEAYEVSCGLEKNERTLTFRNADGTWYFTGVKAPN